MRERILIFIFVSQVQEIKIFCEDCKLATPPVFFQGPWASFSCTSIQVPLASAQNA